MAAQKGNLFLLKLGVAGAGGTLAGMRTTNLSINNTPVDVTTKDSSQKRTLLAGAGVQSMVISALMTKSRRLPVVNLDTTPVALIGPFCNPPYDQRSPCHQLDCRHPQ